MMEPPKQNDSTQIQNFNCGYCNITIQSLTDLKDHLLSQHRDENVVQQELRNDIEKESTSTHEPIRVHNPKMEIVSCKLCENNFKSEKYLQRHIKHLPSSKQK